MVNLPVLGQPPVPFKKIQKNPGARSAPKFFPYFPVTFSFFFKPLFICAPYEGFL